jgi:two-component system, NarL family, invasion response regulator UvrY
MRILIADDHEVVRQGVKQILSDGLGEVRCGEARDAAEMLAQAGKEKWDLVLLDISMPGRSGLEALVELKRQQPRLPVLVLSMFSEREYALRALKDGAAGYVNKSGLSRELIEAVRKAVAGGRYITPALAELLAEGFSEGGPRSPHEGLSDREYEVMKLIAGGKSVKEIAGELALGEKTVFTYRSRLLEKLHLKSDVEIARYALSHRLVE